jgi:hypothetical protein
MFTPSFVEVAAQLDALDAKIGLLEHAGNESPFGVWQGTRNVGWAGSCAQWAAVEFGGFRWPDHCQFGYKGDAYCPYTEQHAKELGIWREPTETPLPGWQGLFDWNGNDVADHIGTFVKFRTDGALIFAEGNYHDQLVYVVRDRKYLLGFVAFPDGGKGHRRCA